MTDYNYYIDQQHVLFERAPEIIEIAEAFISRELAQMLECSNCKLTTEGQRKYIQCNDKKISLMNDKVISFAYRGEIVYYNTQNLTADDDIDSVNLDKYMFYLKDIGLENTPYHIIEYKKDNKISIIPKQHVPTGKHVLVSATTHGQYLTKIIATDASTTGFIIVEYLYKKPLTFKRLNSHLVLHSDTSPAVTRYNLIGDVLFKQYYKNGVMHDEHEEPLQKLNNKATMATSKVY